MIGSLKPYEDLRETGLPWLGDVPVHWEVRRIKTLLKEIDHRTKSGEERLLSLRMRRGLVDHHDSGGKPIPPDALAGKLDVRAAAASLPEVTEPEPIDDLGEGDDFDATENEEVAA